MSWLAKSMATLEALSSKPTSPAEPADTRVLSMLLPSGPCANCPFQQRGIQSDHFLTTMETLRARGHACGRDASGGWQCRRPR